MYGLGCPANEANGEGNTPQKLAKSLGFKDCMKELKKLTSFQDKIFKGGKPKGYAEKWCIQVHTYTDITMCVMYVYVCLISLPFFYHNLEIM